MTTAPDGNAAPSYESPKNRVKGDQSHDWIAAAEVKLDESTAKRAARYQSYLAPEQTRIHVLDVYCSGCRRNLEDVVGKPCEAKIDNTHLIGGDQAHRAKRKVPVIPEGAVVVPGPRINRIGIDAVIRGEL